MYAFGPLPKYKQSGRVIGTHQKIDRVARRRLVPLLDARLLFPSIQTILHFEGSRGPDGIKLKSPGRDEPKHFIDPDNIKPDDALFQMINDHQSNLTMALIARDSERAAFEAAWLAHAVTDGLTPAHHEPFEEQIKEIRGQNHHAGKVRSKVIMSGAGSRRQFVRNNWRYWGAKGIMTTHTLFEAGVATSTKALTFKSVELTNSDIETLKQRGFLALYHDAIIKVDTLHMYQEFKDRGWTHNLGQQTIKVLMPTIIKFVTLSWYDSYQKALEQTK